MSTDFVDRGEVQSRQVVASARTPKLGILALAAVLEQAGYQPVVFDLDSAYSEYIASFGGAQVEDFPAWVSPRIRSTGAGLFGFSSICSSYPLSIRVAESLKRLEPGCTVLFGGPQASVVDRATLTAFPFVDFILRGEADFSVLLFLEQWTGQRQFQRVPGLTWRSPFGIQRNPDAPAIDDLDDLPLPAYHLNPNELDPDYVYLELGRGCPFSCTFCSTNDFFRRKFRVKSPARMLIDMRTVAARYGYQRFDLVHDMFTVDRRRVVSFCEAMIESGEGFRWSCSARTDCVDSDLLHLMARAGCEGIFFGIEAGSKRMQRIIDKDLDLAEARAAVETADGLGIRTTVSVITGFPEETESDLRDTLEVLMHSLRHPLSSPQLNILAPLAGTPISSQHKDRMILEEIGSHISYPGHSQNLAERELIRAHPDIFPNFYLIPTPDLDRSLLLELREFLLMGCERLRWLMVALHQLGPGILDAFRAWRLHRLALYPGMSAGALRHYYTLDTARNDLADFLRGRTAEFGGSAVEALIAYQTTLANALLASPARPEQPAVSSRITARSIPVPAPDVHVLEMDWDIQAVIDSLKAGVPFSASNTRHYYRTAASRPGRRGLMEITPLIARSLAICDGRNTAADFAAHVGPLLDCPQPLRAYAAKSLLKRLRDNGIVEIYGARPVSRGNRRRELQ